MRLHLNPSILGRFLGKLGPTWRCAPLRRLVQTAALFLFMWLLFYVCWPYTARPARTWSGWMPVEVDAQTGRVTVAAQAAAEVPIGSGQFLYATDDSVREDRALGLFHVSSVGPQVLNLQLLGQPNREQLDRIAASVGPWSLGEAEPDAWPAHYADSLRNKEKLPAELFLILDPLVSISTAVAARTWIWSLVPAGAMLLVCLLIPRGFCGYLCPLGTLIDLSDWTVRIGRKMTSALGNRWREGVGSLSPRTMHHVDSALTEKDSRPLEIPLEIRKPAVAAAARPWWTRLKYYLLAATLAAALCGVLISGFVSAMPVVTRGMVFLVAPLQTGIGRGWHQVPPLGYGHALSLALFVLVLGLGLLGPRFWCKHVCPTGALFSLATLPRLSRREVDERCTGCGRCRKVCPFDAVHGDFSTRTMDCTFCQTCGGACPTGAIQFATRWPGRTNLHRPNVEFRGESRTRSGQDARDPAGRRAFLTGTASGLAAAAVAGAGAALPIRVWGARLADPDGPRPVRPPGSVPEPEFLRMCIRCGECFRACPNDVLQPLGLQQGLEGLWTPQVVADWSGCETSCNLCGWVCPTGAIRALPLEEKRVARIALAVVDQATCLPYAGRAACQLCVEECQRAGYQAIEFVRVGTEMDPSGKPIEDTGFSAPVVRPEKCVGCGLCQTRCYGINAVQKGLLAVSAIRIEAGQCKEDRLLQGSYIALREQEAEARVQQRQRRTQPIEGGNDYLPDFVK